ncbi:hypothetical protein [Rhodocyclus gracilis]|uniref:Uncharacterized protein n=1 Tax=Rhodocyclus tenuis TaxID=1066 RepID=A0A6L5JUG4_RHOTE|nr:hypothetical protein [Rhodocyclus gracilis]MQY50180.1 hypothetical protein [Rhodocyclus gracilis]
MVALLGLVLGLAFIGVGIAAAGWQGGLAALIFVGLFAAAAGMLSDLVSPRRGG